MQQFSVKRTKDRRYQLGAIGLPLLLFAWLLSACQPAELAVTEPVTIAIGGSSAMQPVLLALTQEFSRQHPHIFFDISSGDSTTGEERVRMGQIPLAASTLISPTVDTVLNQPTQAQALVRIPIGLDGIVPVVHRDNPIQNLTLLQLQELYNGRIWNWQEVGGNDETVLLVVREDGSGTRMLFDERVMGEAPIALTAVVMPSTEYVIEYIADHPAAIGYVSRAYVIPQLLASSADPSSASPTPQAATGETSSEHSAAATATAATAAVRLVQIEGQLPTKAALQTQTYFLIQPLYLVTNGQPRGWVKQFIDFTISPAGQAIVARHHLPIR